jgi:hypothetical protein
MPPEERTPFDPIQLSPELSAALAAITVTRSDAYKTIYSDAVRTRIGVGDVTIIFSKTTHLPSVLANPNIIEEQAEVIMPLPQLKMFERILRSLVDAFEQEVGVIPIPTSFVINIEGQRQAIRSLGLPVKIEAPEIS